MYTTNKLLLSYCFYLALPFGLLSFFNGIAASEEVVQNIPQPKVDERVELLGIVFHLAGNEEYQVLFPEYADAVNKHFAPFKTHPAIRNATLLRNNFFSIAHDAVMIYALHISIKDGCVVFPDADSEKTLDKLDFRWTPQGARFFARQLDDFYVKSRFHEFFETNRELYQKAKQNIKAVNDNIDYLWFKQFYGAANLEHFHVIISYVGDGGGYGTSVRFKEGREEYFAITSLGDPDVPYRSDGLIALIVHAFSHSFCSPLVDKHFNDLKPAAERVFPFVAERMVRQYYPTPKIMLYQYLVRACTIRYFLHCGDKDKADMWMQYNRRSGFLWIEELVELLGRYEKERDKYPTLDDFMPEIVKMQNTLVTDEYIAELQKQEENRPKVTTTNPPNGAKDVDPSITEITVTFDRPMERGMAWCTTDGGLTYPERSDNAFPVWSEDKQTCTMKNVVLKPGQTYNIWLNSEVELYSDIPGDGFRSATGSVPLRPVHYTFTTRAETE